VQLALFYWREDDGDYLELLAELFADARPTEVALPRLVARLAADLAPERLAAACDVEAHPGPARRRADLRILAGPQIDRVSPMRRIQASSSP
jgi:hypothetical protein